MVSKALAVTESKSKERRAQFLSDLLAIVAATPEGLHPTRIPFMSYIRRDQPTLHQTAVLSPSFCLVLQGRKKIHLDRDSIVYGPGDFAASLIDIPTRGHVAEASSERPYFGIRIDFTTTEIAAVIMEAKVQAVSAVDKNSSASFVGEADEDVLELILRLVRLNDKAPEAAFIGGLVKQELIYRFLVGPYAHLFYQKLLFDPGIDGIGKSLTWIRENFASAFRVEELAERCGLSVSTFHHKFKALTRMGPLQYQKQLRLIEARRLMLGQLKDVATSAFEVGYESPSQFNREYKRFFGESPLRDVKSLRAAMVGERGTVLP